MLKCYIFIHFFLFFIFFLFLFFLSFPSKIQTKTLCVSCTLHVLMNTIQFQKSIILRYKVFASIANKNPRVSRVFYDLFTAYVNEDCSPKF